MDVPKVRTPSFGGSPLLFFKEVKAELKKVKWPTQKAVIKMTGIVIGVSFLVGVYISSLDFIFTKTMEIIVK